MKFLCCNPARLIQENYYFPPWKQILQINALDQTIAMSRRIDVGSGSIEFRNKS